MTIHLFSSVETCQHDYISPHVTVSVSQFAILITTNWSKVGKLLLEGADKAEAGEEDRVVRQFSFSNASYLTETYQLMPLIGRKHTTDEYLSSDSIIRTR